MFTTTLKAMETLNTQLTPFAIRFPALVEELYRNPPGATMAGDSIEATIHNHFAAMSAANHTWKRETFFRLLMVMYNKKCFGVLRNPHYIGVLANISRFGNKTVNPVENWTKDSLTPDGQLASIIKYLFAVYEVPRFMEHVFAEGNIVHMLWYIQLGRGDSVLNLCAFPARFTHKMAHEFRNTPGDVYTVEQAIRRAQALGYGATHRLAENIAWSANVAEIKDNAFRDKVIQFVAKQARGAQFAEIESVMEYVVEKRAETLGFTLKGRTWIATLKAAREYEMEKAKRLAAEMGGDWKALPIANYEKAEGNNVYRIVQLLTSEELYEEGREMSHCVAEYDNDCILGDTGIFSLRRFTDGTAGYETLATLEYRTDENALVQAKAKFNEEVSAEAEVHILAWTKAEDIRIHCELYEFYGVPAPVPQAVQPIGLPAEMPRIVPQPRVDPLLEHHNRMAAQRHGANRGGDIGIDGKTLATIIIIIIRILMAVAKMK